MHQVVRSYARIGEEFTMDEGVSWWRVSRIEPRDDGRNFWIEAVELKTGAILSEVRASGEVLNLRGDAP